MTAWTGYLDGYLKKNLDVAKKVIKDDWDMVFCVDGYEGSGKSVIAQQCAAYCDPSFCMEDVCFTGEEFIKKINKAEKYKSLVYDEAMEGMDSANHWQELNKALKMTMAEIRQKNLFIWVVLPTFFDLNKYVAVWRSRALIHVYTGDGFKRGRFAFYSQDKKKLLYVFGKKYYSYKRPSPNFLGRFVKGYAVDEAEYRKAKRKALRSHEHSAFTKEKDRERKIRIQRNLAILKLISYKMKKKEVAELLGMTQRQIRNVCASILSDSVKTEGETEQ